MPGGAINLTRRFIKDRRGSGTIEFVIWLPVLMSIILLAFDISLTFYSMSRMWDAARYTARGVATGQMDASDASYYANSSLPSHASYEVHIDESGRYDVRVQISSADISPSIGLIVDFAPELATVSYVMRRESF